MVQILPRFDPGGEIGKSIGSGIGEGLDVAVDRKMLKQGITSVKDMISNARENNEQLNPLDVTLSLAEALANKPGGMQAIADLAKPLQDEVLRQNLLLEQNDPNQDGQVQGRDGKEVDASTVDIPKAVPGTPGAIDESKTQPPNSIVEGSGVGKTKKSFDETPSEQWNSLYKDYLKKTGSPSQAADLASQQVQQKSKEQDYRLTRQVSTAKLLDEKIQSNFPNGISAPFQNELSKEFFDLTEKKDVNQAWNELMPKYRNAQRAEESLKESTGANRPLLFNGDLSSRKDNARVALQDITDIDPEYAVGLAQSDLDYGLSEASSIVKEGDKVFSQFVSQIPEMTVKRAQGGTQPGLVTFPVIEKINESQRKLEQFLSNKWNTDKDSFLSLRGFMNEKGFPDEKFLETVQKVFPDGYKDSKLSEFNRNEINKLGEPTIPGLQEVFSSFLRNFTGTTAKFIGGKLRGKK